MRHICNFRLPSLLEEIESLSFLFSGLSINSLGYLEDFMKLFIKVLHSKFIKAKI